MSGTSFDRVNFSYPSMTQPAPKTVLVAEEDDAVREGLIAELRKEGYRVVGLEDGLELRDYLEAAYAQDATVSQPAVVISDASLPGIGGIEVCAELHHQDSWPGFIVLADHNQFEVFEAAERAGADFVFDKPIDVEELRNVVSWLASGNE
jgi:CheY-like chemotaxis protein